MYFFAERIGKVLEVLEENLYPAEQRITHYKYKQTEEKGFENGDVSDWADYNCETDTWRGYRTYFWFVTDVIIPDAFEGKPVVYDLSTGAEGGWDAINPQFYVYVNGKLIQGLDTNHRYVVLTQNAGKGECFHIALYAYTSNNTGHLLLNSRIAVLDRSLEKLYYDLKVPMDVANLLPAEDQTAMEIVFAVNEAVNLIDLRQIGSEAFSQSVLHADAFMETEFYQKKCGTSGAVVKCVGHTHIDVAWLWTLAVTREKAVRSFSTMLELMNQYPEFIFISSQPQLYKYVKEDAPSVYEQIKARVKEGRWEAEGAMFLEADCNISSGESLIRQILFGKRFFQQEFGVDNKILWLPDVFGYSVALPQILKKSGVDYFMTTKISWSELNQFPYDTFKWRGIDGSEILTHFVPATDFQPVMKTHMTTYNAYLNASQVKGAWQRYQQKHLNKEVLMSFGFGDGGGGTTKEMLENQRRLKRGIPGCPKTEITTARNFFDTLKQEVCESRFLPTWSGELYLEYHRGTYTSMARNKKANRKSEFLLETAEKLCAMNLVMNGTAYPGERINEQWETVLRNQFHDILPGSSIKEVYEDSREEYETVRKNGEEIVSKALAEMISVRNIKENAFVVYNASGVVVDDVISVPFVPDSKEELGVVITDEKGDKTIHPVQKTAQGDSLFYAKGLKANSFRTFAVTKAPQVPDHRLSVSKHRVETPFFVISFNEKMQITGILDKKEQRQVMPAGAGGNVLCAYEDLPHKFDAWDINSYYKEKMWEIDDVTSVEITETGPVRACIEVERRFLNSVIKQEMRFYADLPKIDFKTFVDWKEDHILVRASFPVDVHAEEATFDVQYGNVMRPCHTNTSWDFARFEVCAHKWTDISEDNYGVSMLNDCKFGHDVHNGVMSISLIKSATDPNPEADKEQHTFSYALYPHRGSWKNAATVSYAYALNNPPFAVYTEPHTGRISSGDYAFVECGQENVVIEVIKKAEDGNGIILRLNEYYNRRTDVTLKFNEQVVSAYECDLMEQEEEQLPVLENGVSFAIKPYEIKTIRIDFKSVS